MASRQGSKQKKADGIDYVTHALRFVVVDMGTGTLHVYKEADAEEDQLVVKRQYGVTKKEEEMDRKYWSTFIKEAKKIHSNEEGGLLHRLEVAYKKFGARDESPKRGSMSEADIEMHSWMKEGLEYTIRRFQESGSDKDNLNLTNGELFLSQILLQ